MKFNLNATVTISLYTCVEAVTLEEAIEIAKERGIEKARNSESQSMEVWVSDEFDGEPINIYESK